MLIPTGTITMTIEDYEAIRAEHKKMYEEIIRLTEAESSARELSRHILDTAIQVTGEYDLPTMTLHFVPEVVSLVNEKLAAMKDPNGALYQLDVLETAEAPYTNHFVFPQFKIVE